jgi:Fe-S-cluster containining protein
VTGVRDLNIEQVAQRHRLEVFLASREAGQALTADVLGTGVSLESIAAVAADVSSYADEAIAIVREEYSPALHCQEGCAFCCCKPGVLVTVPEFVRVIAHVRSAFTPQALAELTHRAGQYVAQLAGRSFNDPTPASVPCPLLVADRCSVYITRPLVCRGYNSTDVAACRRAHTDPGVLVPVFAIVKDVTDGTAVGICHGLEQAGVRRRTVVDLGTALHVVLSGGVDLLSSEQVGGADVLAPAEEPSWASELWRRVREAAGRLGVQIPGATGV